MIANTPYVIFFYLLVSAASRGGGAGVGAASTRQPRVGAWPAAHEAVGAEDEVGREESLRLHPQQHVRVWVCNVVGCSVYPSVYLSVCLLVRLSLPLGFISSVVMYVFVFVVDLLLLLNSLFLICCTP